MKHSKGKNVQNFTKVFRKQALPLNVPLDSLEPLMKYSGSLHGYFRHSLLLFEPKTLDEASVKVVHLERMGKHEKDNHPKGTSTTKRKEDTPYCTYCEKEGHDEEHCWKLHFELRPKMKGRKEKQKIVATVQKDPESESEDDVKITVTGFSSVGPIDLGSNLVDEMNIIHLGTIEYGPIKLGFNSGDEANISIDVVSKMRRAPNTAYL